MTARVMVAGLGKLGSAIAAVLAGEHDVIGFDVNPAPVNQITAGQAPVDEPGLAELIAERGGRTLRTTTVIRRAVRSSDIAFVVVPTPSDDMGRFVNRYVADALVSIGLELNGTSRPYTVVIVSTVMPGSCAGPLRGILEHASDRDDIGLVYAPAFIALGSVIHDFTHPDMLLVGCDDPTGASVVTSVLLPVIAGAVPVHRMSLLDAELSKLALNVCLSVKVAYANEVAQICERLGGDAEKVLASVGADSRIGPGFLQVGPTASGPCLPRDLLAFDRVACDVGRPAFLAAAANRIHVAEASVLLGRLVDLADAHRAKGDGATHPLIGILGAAYKVGTHVTDESVGVRVAERAKYAGLPVVMHDPKAKLPVGVLEVDDGQQVIEMADVVLIATPWPEYKTLDFAGKPIIDLWGEAPRAANVHRFGRGDSC